MFRPGNRGGAPLELPPGWLNCPPFGKPPIVVPGKTLNVIPSKVPLSYDYASLIPPNKQYTLRDAVSMLAERGHPVGLVLDLTNSYRYYRFNDEFPDAEKRQLYYKKVACRGKCQSPQPEAVNEAVYEIWCFMAYHPDKYVLVHCTHGLNRTGYVIACTLVRLMSEFGMTVERSVRRFAEARPPGIYKDGYLSDLFKYHHEKRHMSKIATPPVPSWKGVDGRDDEEDVVEEPAAEAPVEIPGHDKIFEIGEKLHQDEVS